jgi:hypothetical protein
MEAKDIEVGAEYALREPPKSGAALQRVRVLEKVRSQWRVRWIEPNDGLEDFVKSASLVAPWKQRTAFLRDEERRAAVVRRSAEQWDGSDGPVSGAVQTVLDATGEHSLWVDNHGVLQGDPESLERVADRSGGVKASDDAFGFKDRRGRQHEPFSVALQIATAFAAAEPATVLLAIEADEQQLEMEIGRPGGGHLIGLHNMRRAENALVRQWAGHDQAIARREAQLKELRDLVWRTIWDLRRPEADPERIASQLERALGRS